MNGICRSTVDVHTFLVFAILLLLLPKIATGSRDKTATSDDDCYCLVVSNRWETATFINSVQCVVPP
jgi:hypothetical protein